MVARSGADALLTTETLAVHTNLLGCIETLSELVEWEVGRTRGGTGFTAAN